MKPVVLRSRLEATIRGLPLRFAICRGPVQTMPRGRQAQCAKCQRLRLWRRLRCRGRPMAASTYGFELATEVGAQQTVLTLQSRQPQVWWSLSCTRGLWETERAGPDDDSRMFLGELGAVAVGRLFTRV